MTKDTNAFNISFIDVLMILACMFIFFCAIIITLINKPTPETEGIVSHVAYKIKVEWDKESLADVDTHILTPNNGWCCFRRLNVDMVNLQRDDTGESNDNYFLNGVLYTYKENIEEIDIRKVMPGQYVINLHMFHGRNCLPCKINVVIYQIQQKITVIFQKEIELTVDGDEDTVCVLEFNDNEQLINIDTETKHQFVKTER